MSYFADPIDLIPDHFPGIGFLDDAIFVEIVIRELNAEIEAYDEFCQFRSAEERKRSEAGKDPDENREEWITSSGKSCRRTSRKSAAALMKSSFSTCSSALFQLPKSARFKRQAHDSPGHRPTIGDRAYLDYSHDNQAT